MWPQSSPRPVVACLQRRNFSDARHIALQALLLTTRNGATPLYIMYSILCDLLAYIPMHEPKLSSKVLLIEIPHVRVYVGLQ